MAKVNVVVDIGPEGRYTVASRELPDVDPIKRLAEASGKNGLTLCPSKLAQDALGVGPSALHQFVDRYDKERRIGRIVVGGKRYLTLEQLDEARRHYGTGKVVGGGYVATGKLAERFSRERLKEIFGAGNVASIHNWMDDIFGEEPPAEKSVCGVKVLRHKPRSDIVYFIPNELVEDEDRLEEWGRKFYWEARRARLPKKYRNHSFTLELAQECDVSKKAVEDYVAGRGNGFGTKLAAGMERELDRAAGEKSTTQFLYNPEETGKIRQHFARTKRLEAEYYTLREFERRINAPERSFREWFNANVGDNMRLFGVAVEMTPRGLRIPKDALTDEQYAELRGRPKTNAKLADLEAMLSAKGPSIPWSASPQPAAGMGNGTESALATAGETPRQDSPLPPPMNPPPAGMRNGMESAVAPSEERGERPREAVMIGGLPKEAFDRLDRLVDHFSRNPPDYEYVRASFDLLTRQTGAERRKMWEHLIRMARGRYWLEWDKWKKELGREYREDCGREMP